MTADFVLTTPLIDALEHLCADGRRVLVVPVAPPAAAQVIRWRVARAVTEVDGSVTVTAVGEIEGTIGCNERPALD